MLIRQTLAYFPAQILSPLTQFATAIILTHYLGAADYGLTMLVFASQELIFQVCLAWWTTYFLRYAGNHEEPEAQARLARTESTVLLLTGLLQVLATLVLVAFSGHMPSLAFTLGACLYVLTRSYVNFLSEKARREVRILDYTLLQLGAPLGSLLLTLLLTATLGTSPTRVLLDFALIHAIIAALAAWRMKAFARPGQVDRALLRSAIGFGVPVAISNLFGWLAAQGVRFVVQAGAGAAALGLLSVGWGLAGRLATVSAMVVTAAAYPLAVRAMDAGDPDGARRQLANNSALLLGLIAPSTVGVIAITDPFVTLLVASEFRAATIDILPWALAGAAIRNLRMHGWDQMYLLFEAPRPMVTLEGLEALVTLIAAALGLAWGGITGAVIGTTVATVLVAIADYIYLSRRFGLHAPLTFYLKIALATAGMLLVLMAMPRLGLPITPDVPSLALAVLAGMTSYALGIGALFGRELRTGWRQWRAARG